jgi:FemAB-related protein (PEP-CTERM system-associated)
MINKNSISNFENLDIKRLYIDDVNANARWDNFVFSCENTTFFHRAGWQLVIKEIFKHETYFLYAEVKGEIVGVLPLAHVNSRIFGNALTSLPFAVYGGAVANDEIFETALEIEATKLAAKLGVDHLEFRNLKRKHDDWPCQDLYVTFRRDIYPTDDENLKAIPRKQRAMVRKGIKNNLLSVIDKNSDRFFDLYADNVHRHGTPAMPKRYFDKLVDVFGKDCEILTIVDFNKKPISSVLSFYFKNEVLPYYAGDDFSARELAANDFKYWELMRLACERGLKIFDFGRSKVGTGSFSFKKNWGFEGQPLSYEYCLYTIDGIPQNNPLNNKYKLFIYLWKKMPISLANYIGPMVVRNLG